MLWILHAFKNNKMREKSYISGLIHKTVIVTTQESKDASFILIENINSKKKAFEPLMYVRYAAKLNF